MDRRGFLRGLAGCFAAAAAPAVLPSGIIMPVRSLVVRDPFGRRGWVPWKIDVNSGELNEAWMDHIRYGTGATRTVVYTQLSAEKVRIARLRIEEILFPKDTSWK